MSQLQYNPQLSYILNMQKNQNIKEIPMQPLYESTKVWVSKIPDNVSDTFIQKLLESCGTVTSWKRLKDSNGKPKSFGLCEYETVEGMLKSLRLLNNFPLDNSVLQVSFLFNL